MSSCQKLSNAANHVCSFIYLFKLCHLLKEVLGLSTLEYLIRLLYACTRCVRKQMLKGLISRRKLQKTGFSV
jgi:hypothetical protein